MTMPECSTTWSRRRRASRRAFLAAQLATAGSLWGVAEGENLPARDHGNRREERIVY
jgi:hypothetical protein